MLIATRSLWFAQTNVYVIAGERGGPGIIIDAPPDPDAVLDLVVAEDIVPVALLLTHGHVDHMGGSGAVAERAGVVSYVHPDDDFLTMDPKMQVRSLFGIEPPGDYRPAERFEALIDCAEMDLAGLSIEVLHTPGHTPGHCCFYISDEGLLFSGDHLFAGSIGRTDLPGGDFGMLMESMRTRIDPLPGETSVHPGHGPATTLAHERQFNPFLQD